MSGTQKIHSRLVDSTNRSIGSMLVPQVAETNE